MVETSRLWSLLRATPYLDADVVASAIDEELAAAATTALDYRTRLLIRRCSERLAELWGQARHRAWAQAPARAAGLAPILAEDFEEEGFSTLRERLIVATKPTNIHRLLEHLDCLLSEPVDLFIGGSCCVILAQRLTRHTDDLDVVDEVPRELRTLEPRYRALATQLGLRLAHCQSHYLPAGWKERCQPYGDFRHLRVRLVDPLDFFVAKLFSSREKDQADLLAMVDQFDASQVAQRVRRHAQGLWADPRLRERAQAHWRLLYGVDFQEGE